jgi:hypothetical protein
LEKVIIQDRGLVFFKSLFVRSFVFFEEITSPSYDDLSTLLQNFYLNKENFCGDFILNKVQEI